MIIDLGNIGAVVMAHSLVLASGNAPCGPRRTRRLARHRRGASSVGPDAEQHHDQRHGRADGKGVQGDEITLKYKDGEKKIVVAPNTTIVTYVPADKSARRQNLHRRRQQACRPPSCKTRPVESSHTTSTNSYQNSQTPTCCVRPTGTSIAKTYGGPMGYRRRAQARTVPRMSQCLRSLVLEHDAPWP
jgi:hypothetical protein